MKKPAKIYLLEKDNDFSAIFTGTVDDTPNGYFVEYEDADGSPCIIGFSKGIATVTKTKDPGYSIILEEGCPHPFDITTPFGTISAVANPLTVRSRKHNDSRLITIIYELNIGNERFKHELKLRIEPEEEA